jgi:glycosyltransferase involved in cell wall biosynthesis
MRILHVTYIFPPKAEVADGITQVVYGLTRALAKKGHDVTVYASNALDLHGKGRIEIDNSPAYIDGVKVRYFPYLLRYGTIFFTPSIFYSVRDDIKEFDVIHIHDARCLQCAITTYYAELFNIPIVFQPHGSFKSPFPSGRLRKLSRLFIDALYAEKVFKKASKIVGLSRLEAEQYRGMGVLEEKIEVIPNGIDLSEYGDLPPKGSFKKKFSIDDDEKIILYLGRIHRSKGIDFLIEAFAHLIKDLKFEDTLLVIAGPNDGYLSEAKSLVSALGIPDRVLFTGLLTEYEKVSAFVDSSVVISPERLNVFLLVPVEAAACGKQVIVSSTNYISHMIREGGFGFSVKYGDIDELAENMGKILVNDELLREMGRKGRKYVFENFNWTDIVVKLEKVYEEIVDC